MREAIAVVVPARNEARWIREVVATMPPNVTDIIVVDDASDDGTSDAAAGADSDRVMVVRHDRRRGVGGAIVSGYRRGLATNADVFVVMAGDAQMDPADLPNLVEPILSGHADYVKGNRLRHPEARAMPPIRAAGTAILGAMTSLATGVPVGDSQCGYTAISRAALDALNLDAVWRGYGYPNDLLGHLARARLRVREVPVRPVYRGADSGLRPYHAAVIVFLLGRIAWRRAANRTPLNR